MKITNKDKIDMIFEELMPHERDYCRWERMETKYQLFFYIIDELKKNKKISKAKENTSIENKIYNKAINDCIKTINKLKQ